MNNSCIPKFGRHRITGLSDKERTVLYWMAEGKTNKQIAELLFRSHSTIKGHVDNILTKLDAVDRTHAVAKAIRQGVL